MKTINALAYALTLLCFTATDAAAQNNWTLLPDALRRPQRGEALRYPSDTVIGDLSQGAVDDEAYRAATRFLSALVEQNRDAPVLAALDTAFLVEVIGEIAPLATQKIRLGSGRNEDDGTISFLIRLLGTEQWISGELYLRFEYETWIVDDLILEQVKTFSTDDDKRTAPYERVF